MNKSCTKTVSILKLNSMNLYIQSYPDQIFQEYIRNAFHLKCSNFEKGSKLSLLCRVPEQLGIGHRTAESKSLIILRNYCILVEKQKTIKVYKNNGKFHILDMIQMANADPPVFPKFSFYSLIATEKILKLGKTTEEFGNKSAMHIRLLDLKRVDSQARC
uniref:Uncharacterized protein n=1 Tax=Romanomermis culicivorax TaxID=13658 RepID=A0A915JMQ6_ROMCU